MNFEALLQWIPSDVRALLRNQTLRLRRPIQGRRWGHHASRQRGPGLDFRDHRPYVPGDDLRRVDWKAVGRRDRLVMRQTDTEDELAVALLVDGGVGMSYGVGTSRKFSVAATMTASLAALALGQGDPIGFAIGGSRRPPELTVVPRRSDELARQLAASLREHTPSDRCPWPDLIATAARALPPRSLVVAIGDFLDPGGRGESSDDEAFWRALLALGSRQHQIVLVQVLHDDELTFPWREPQPLRFVDLWTSRPAVEGSGATLREGYLARLELYLRAFQQQALRQGILLERVRADEPLAPALLRLLRRLEGAGEAG